MFPENLVQACFQQIQTVYTLKKAKNATAEAMQMTTTAGYDSEHIMYHEPDEAYFYRDVDEPTTAVSRNLSGVAEEAWKRSLEYTDGINVLG